MRVDRSEILHIIRQLNLVSEQDLDRLVSDSAGDLSSLAASLVEAKKLTPYQASALLQRKGRGLLLGQYVIETKLGTGDIGVVFKARHRPSQRVVALIILDPMFGGDPTAVRQFRREMQVASRLRHPNIVRVIGAGVRDDGLRHLSGLRNLRRITLWHTKVTDAGLVHLKPLRRLEDLLLGRAPLTDDGLEPLESLQNLRKLWLDDTHLTDAGIVHLKSLSTLLELNLNRTAVTGVGVAELKGLRKLERLYLEGTRLGDNGISNLKGLNQLKEIDIRKTKVTALGVRELKKILPYCNVMADQRK